MKSKNIDVAFVQLKVNPDPKINLDRMIDYIKEAAKKGAKLIVLPELHSYPYFCQTHDEQNFSLAETIPGPTTDRLTKVAKKYNIIIISSIFERQIDGLYYNSSVVISEQGEILDKYRKIHIPDDPRFHEKYYFTPGDLGFKVVTTSIGRIGLLICWDQWFPEAARALALNGAELIVIPTAIGWLPEESEKDHKRQLNAWITIQRAHAIANGVHLISCNRVGFEPHPKTPETGINFWGNSFMSDPFGEILTQANSSNEELCIQSIDLNNNQKIRKIWPFFRDRRPSCYDKLI